MGGPRRTSTAANVQQVSRWVCVLCAQAEELLLKRRERDRVASHVRSTEMKIRVQPHAFPGSLHILGPGRVFTWHVCRLCGDGAERDGPHAQAERGKRARVCQGGAWCTMCITAVLPVLLVE